MYSAFSNQLNYRINMRRTLGFTLSNYYLYHSLKKFIISVIIVSFSSGLLSATINVIATKALSLIICLPLLYSELFLFKNSKNKEAPIRLHPSANGWSLIKKYNRFAAFSSILWYTSTPKTFWYTASRIPLSYPLSFSTPQKRQNWTSWNQSLFLHSS